MDLKKTLDYAKKKRKENKKFFNKLKRKKRKELDAIIHPLHEKVFACTDCLQCANCCKTTGPLFTRKDIARIAKKLRLKPADFIDQYLRVDEENDYVLQQVPCPFLGTDNYCNIYDVRPKACREFPHTNRLKQDLILQLTQKNVEICPAVHEIIERLKEVVK